MRVEFGTSFIAHLSHFLLDKSEQNSFKMKFLIVLVFCVVAALAAPAPSIDGTMDLENKFAKEFAEYTAGLKIA